MKRSGSWLFVIALAVASVGPAWADRRDTEAANLYRAGCKEINNGRYREGIRLLQQALDRGATEPNEEQGGEERFLVAKYDPYYWLGVAYMELHEYDKALVYLDRSESFGVVKNWKKEFADLRRRRDILDRELTLPTPTSLPTLPPPSPIPSAVPMPPTIVIPRPTAPFPTELPIVVQSPTPDRRLPATLQAARARLDDWLREPSLPVEVRQSLETRRQTWDSPSSPRAGSPDFDRWATQELKRFESDVVPAVRSGLLETAIGLLARRDWASVERLVGLARRADPASPQPDALACAAYTTRFILEGRKDSTLLDAGRATLRAWRTRSRSSHSMPEILSPHARRALGQPS